jgi:hypothetical protein
LQLQQLLADCLTGELECIGKLGDGGGPLTLQRQKDRAPAVGKLFNGDDGGLLGVGEPLV